MAEAKTEAKPKAPKGGPPPKGKSKEKAVVAGAVEAAPKVSEGVPRLLEYYQKTIRPRLRGFMRRVAGVFAIHLGFQV